jgi:hypothetical protein
MGLDLGGALAVFRIVAAGNTVSLDPGYDMGGKTSNWETILGNSLGCWVCLTKPPQVIQSSELTPPRTTSMYFQYPRPIRRLFRTRGDLYRDGNNSELQMSRFINLYNLQKEAKQPNYSMDVILEYNINRYYESLNNNPYFWYGSIGGPIIHNVAYAFTSRLFANYSEDYPTDGILGEFKPTP